MPGSSQPGGPPDPQPRWPGRTLEESGILDAVARTEGREWVERHAELILEQARAIGNL